MKKYIFYSDWDWEIREFDTKEMAIDSARLYCRHILDDGGSVKNEEVAICEIIGTVGIDGYKDRKKKKI